MGCLGYVPLVAGDMFQVAGDMFCCDGGKTKSTPSPTDLDLTVRLDWSLTKLSKTLIVEQQPNHIITYIRFDNNVGHY